MKWIIPRSANKSLNHFIAKKSSSSQQKTGCRYVLHWHRVVLKLEKVIILFSVAIFLLRFATFLDFDERNYLKNFVLIKIIEVVFIICLHFSLSTSKQCTQVCTIVYQWEYHSFHFPCHFVLLLYWVLFSSYQWFLSIIWSLQRLQSFAVLFC